MGSLMYRDYIEPAWSAQQLLLIALLVVPAVGALVVALLPAARSRLVAVSFAAVTFVLSVLPALVRPADFGWFAYTPLDSAPPAPWIDLDLPWVPALGLEFHLGVDGVSYPLIVLTGLLTLLCCAYTPKKGLAALLLVL
ncbi:NADH-quinone oxidoreductase subunit M, partial [Actinoplanes philippinensis]